MGSPGVGNMLELNSYGEKRQPANLRKNITTVFFYGGVGGGKLAEKLSFPDGKLLRLKVAI
ncbi:TPA_asm: hypothetical protein G1461_01455 [Salmonella enterica]|uniref:Uncharacterized protein n=2 Tax=Salmonella enterica TaxID=28901 RepID=A0A701XIC2_SALER|nr:hypothetical protein [Salmonella enterica subsp. enterica serovar Derby]EBH4674551.1 hypothetical protein [Salmonella enterica]ESH27395.1 hypothetical protein SEED0626_07409 [Salmonella enterica subsp. enterica serovar Derby str. 626]OXY62320.1 hypothetical protein P730_10040 [Salmonella enterica subsp. enterica serovar Enteritidis str. SHSE004]EBH4679378.1 hypothetical protein [Salmonella enterica]